MKNINFDAVMTMVWSLCTVLEVMAQDWNEALLYLCLAIVYYILYKGKSNKGTSN